jgi:hypothetical protein
MKKEIGTVFEELLTRYITSVEKNIKSRIKTARDTNHVRAEITDEIEQSISWSTFGENQDKLAEAFLSGYKRGEDITKIFVRIRKQFGEDVEDILPFRRIENGKKINLYLSDEEKALKELALNDRKLMKFLVRHITYLDIKNRLPELLIEKQKSEPKQSTPPLKWTGTKDNKNEFVQLIYGLHKAGLINNGKGEITKITEDLAGVFGISLGNNWQSNHSASIHKAKRDYQPSIFRKIQEAYQTYTENLIEDKKKNK